MTSLSERIAAWSLGGDTGISSQNIARATLGMEPTDQAFYPLDMADLGRCLRLVNSIPECARGITALGRVSPVWAAIDQRWGEMVITAAEEGNIGEPRRGLYQPDRSRYPKTYAILQACQRADR